MDIADYRSTPPSLLSGADLDAAALSTMRAAWLVETNEPLTGAQLADARHLAARAGLTVESRDPGPACPPFGPGPAPREFSSRSASSP
jgi:hypothetical protein